MAEVEGSTVIAGYRLVERLYHGSRTVVYRALSDVEKREPRSVIIKILQRNYPTFTELLQFRHQYTLTKNLTIPGIVRPYALETHENGYALILEDWNGISLRDYLNQWKLSITETIKIALQLSTILNQIHSNHIIHKDIKPENILIQVESKQIKIIDFSIASLLPKETQEIKNLSGLEGTLAYLAPEQTGRMNRGIDYRADLYALGVTLFELCTGELPFQSEDPMELVHCHLAKRPIAPHELANLKGRPEFPMMLSRIILKLMAKNAEDRYQNALGLHHDLQICLEQLLETGTIAEFEMGQADRSDRFLIPERLYGRETEVQQLLTAFDRAAAGKSELMLVAGFSGIGKTAVVNEVHKPIVRQRGYFIKGKFDQFNRDIPFSAFVQAFQDLIRQLLSESDAQLNDWKDAILVALGNNAQVIVEVIPELEQIIGPQAIVPELSGTAAQNRFNLLFQKFIQVFTQPTHPLVIFLDDLQWADSASLKLIQVLMSESDAGYLFLIGAYRDNEVETGHVLTITLKAIAQSGNSIHTITLNPLSEKYLNHLVADTLHCSEAITTPLTQWIYRKTQGNPFFTTQFLKALHQDGLITFQPRTGTWECDMVQVRSAILTDDVVELMAIQIQKFPTETQMVLKLAACLGNQFDLTTLAIATEQSETETAAAVWPALQEGLVIPKSDVYKFYTNEYSQSEKMPNLSSPTETMIYQFLHDRVQQAAYSLIPEVDRPRTHLNIGRLLWDTNSESDRDTHLFEIVNHWNRAIDHLEDDAERDRLIQLNWQAGNKAKLSAAYEPALGYFELGIRLLSSLGWQTHREMTLAFHESAAEMASLCGNIAQTTDWVDRILHHATNPFECVKAYVIQTQVYVLQGQSQHAFTTAQTALAQFNVDLPADPTANDIQRAFQEVEALLEGRSPHDLLTLPPMVKPEPQAIMQLIEVILPIIYANSPYLFIFLVLIQVKQSIQYGNMFSSPFGYSTYGMLLGGLAGKFEVAYQFGQLALDLSQQYDNRVIQLRTEYVFSQFILHYKSSCHEIADLFRERVFHNLEVGDLEFTGGCAVSACLISYLTGQELTSLASQSTPHLAVLQKLKLNRYVIYLRVNLAAIQHLQSASGEDDFTNDALCTELINSSDMYGLHLYWINRLIVAYLFHRDRSAANAAIATRQTLEGALSLFTIPVFYFYDSLTALANVADQSIPLQVVENQEKLKERAHHAPMNFQHKYDLVEAECHRVLGNQYAAMEYYDRAISGAKTHRYFQEEALANELAARFYLSLGKEKIAAGYLQDAYYGYERWGAIAKTQDLETRYPQLLRPILQLRLGRSSSVEPTSLTFSASRSRGTSEVYSFDFASVLKAAQALSHRLQLNELMESLTQIMMENSGAQTCALILPTGDEWQVRAFATLSSDMAPFTSAHPLEESTIVPVKLIQYVRRTCESVSIQDGTTSISAVIGNYMNHHRPQSVWCTPILNQDRLIGILYLEHRSAMGVFVEERLDVLRLLTTQAAISLENALLYQTLEQKVEQRTQELHAKNQELSDTLHQLRHTQTQLIQSEKMLSLGQLVAGIAHEINNPINFVHGNLCYLENYTQDLLDLLMLYQAENPNSSRAIAQKIDDIDLDFLRQDAPNLFKSMTSGTQRIREIIRSLRTFSRLDESDVKSIDIHEGIDSALMILDHRLQADLPLGAIQVVKEYGHLPFVHCHAGQINQVVMNLLTNAIDALAEQRLSQENLATIHIRTIAIDTRIQLAIADNGTGIPDAIRHRIFDPFFTTKSVGKGIGMGLATSYQIITENHQGTIVCHSQPGKGSEFVIEIPLQ